MDIDLVNGQAGIFFDAVFYIFRNTGRNRFDTNTILDDCIKINGHGTADEIDFDTQHRVSYEYLRKTFCQVLGGKPHDAI